MIKYLKIKLDNEEVDVDNTAEFPITFDYNLEDSQDFQKKKSSESIGLKIAGTLKNQAILNTFNNTSVEDLTPKKTYKNIRNIIVEANGEEIFIGKAIPKKSTKRNGRPTSFELNCFGNNADWLIGLKETSLFELIKHITLIFDVQTIKNSWAFDGTNEAMPYVFAPVKYSKWMDEDLLNDKNYSVKTMKPSLSVYWILYWGFKSQGYRIQSEFFNSNYFRRLTLPWTYGSFLSSEGTKYEIHRFLAKSTQEIGTYGDYTGYVNLQVFDNVDSGCYDNNNTVLSGDFTGATVNGGGIDNNWTYNAPDYGPLEITFSVVLFYNYLLDLTSYGALEIQWFKNGALIFNDRIFEHTGPTFGYTDGTETITRYFSTTVQLNDVITCKFWVDIDRAKYADTARINLKVDQLQIDYFRIPIGGTVSFDSYLQFQKSKFLDYLRGISDLFNLSFQTDPVNKIVLIEPTHDYSLNNDLGTKQGGYFNKNVIDFTELEDISQDSIIELYDDNAREFVFKFKDDSNDGALKIVQDRYKINLASGKYVFSERFKAEKKEFENRFFSPTMHYLVDDFGSITGVTPQMICLVPENISNTSSSEAANTFSPKIAFYKGLQGDVGGWVFNDMPTNKYPYMFSVNYKNGGENDPILSYTDENIGNQAPYVVGKGLLKRFFWQRLAIMNNGQWLNSQFMLNNKHITNWFHRERINIDGELWELLSIRGYNFLSDNSTKCVLRKWVPISKEQLDNTYPSEKSILLKPLVVITPPVGSNGNEIDKVFDSQYNRLMCLYNDIPKPE